MTVIIAGNTDLCTYMFADSGCGTTDINHSRYESKIFKLKGVGNKAELLVGFSGPTSVTGLIKAYMVKSPLEKSTCKDFLKLARYFKEMFTHVEDLLRDKSILDQSGMIVAGEGMLLEIMDGVPVKVNDYAAIGSGGEVASILLEAGIDPEKTVREVIRRDASCSGDVLRETIIHQY